MSYQKHNWVTREIIRRQLLQNIEDGIYNEQERAIAAEVELGAALSTETSRAVEKENQLNASIVNVNNALTSEVSRATTKENNLQTSISNETTRATGVEGQLSTNISNVSSSLSTEVSRAMAAEATLQGNIDSEETRASAAEATLSSNIAAERTRAQNAESDLHDYVDQQITRTYKPSGSIYFAELPTLSASSLGNVYDIKDAFTTTSDFAEGAGKSYPVGTNVAIVDIGNNTLKYDVLPGFVDTSLFYNTGDSTETTIADGDYFPFYDVSATSKRKTLFSNFRSKLNIPGIATLSKAGIVKPDGTTTSIDSDGTIHSLSGGQATAEAAERMIAPIEPDASASIRTYTVGQRLILNDILYKVTNSIAVGDALVINTNISADDNITSQLDTKYDTLDSASTTINDTDYVPMSTSGGTRKKTLWSTIIAKVKTALGIASSGSTYLKKDGTWGTPTNTTYTFETGDSNGQIKVTPSGGSAQNVNVKGLGSAAYDNTVPISHGGTGATTRLEAAKNLTNEDVGANAEYFVTLTTNWGKFGWSSIANIKSVLGLGTAAYTNSSAYAAAGHTHNYAGSNSAGGPANLIYTPRSGGNYNDDIPGLNKTKIVEHSTESPNRPSDHWYYVMTSQGADPNYATQLALGMTTTLNYFREYQGGSWSPWYRLYTTANKPSKSDVGLGDVENVPTTATNRGWAANNVSWSTIANGYYGVNPNQIPTELQSLFSSYSYFSTYGVLYLNGGANGVYPHIEYMDVYGQVARWNSNQNTWRPFRRPTGNATAAQVLSGYTFSNESGDGLSGSMPYRDYRSQYPALATGHNGTGSYVYIPYGYYAPVENNDRTWIYLTDSQAQNLHKHTATKTPTGGELNSSAMDLGDFHGYKYVNTSVCYNRGAEHYANNRSGYASSNGGTELRIDLYDIKPGTVLKLSTTTSSRLDVVMRDSNGNYLGGDWIQSGRECSLTVPSNFSGGTLIVYLVPGSGVAQSIWTWWTLSNPNY